ncbi:2,3-bisphosphoglycerate-independent phosphoglycerate mutase [Candidatus Woesearchaeota archaeon]|nr:2,3-bisphosphoglycerate-independent phosphoglycerate mutase [Candidatus Woesearchaeota archaeon]
MVKNKVILVIRDGWGFRSSKNDNAIASSDTPNTDFLMKKYPNVLVNASGEAVGVPKGYQGNSEVGHMTIGSGRIILQSLERINNSIRDKSFFSNSEFLGAINNCKKHGSSLHIAGLLQEEGVHSHISHLFALLDLCESQNFRDVKLHLFTDGRDSPVTHSLVLVRKVKRKLVSLGFGVIVSVSGRYYAMDRDKRWDRTRKVYDCVVLGKASDFDDVESYIKLSHGAGVTDEFIVPGKLKGYAGFGKDDSFIFFNFRTDRTRQLTRAIVEPFFGGWFRCRKKVFFVGMTQYYKGMNARIAFNEQVLSGLLGGVVAGNGLKQLRISETEKYAHVTFFFNGQVEKPFRGERRILVPSPRVATYDLKPEMSAFEVTSSLVREIDRQEFDFVVVNLVNGDMVGHTGVVSAIKKGVEAVDSCVGSIVSHGLKNGYDLLILADHGNAEDQTPAWRTSHTVNPVPFIFVSDNPDFKNVKLLKGKGLRDVAPTVLSLLGLPKPDEMTGESIIKF